MTTFLFFLHLPLSIYDYDHLTGRGTQVCIYVYVYTYLSILCKSRHFQIFRHNFFNNERGLRQSMDCCNINCIAFCTQPDVVWQKGIYLDAWHAMALADRDLNGQQFEIYDALEVIHCACHQHYECLQPSSFTQCSFAFYMCCEFFSLPVYRIVHPR